MCSLGGRELITARTNPLLRSQAVAGPNWLILVFFVGGMYQCTTPEYILRTGQDVFGLAPQYGITLDAAARAARYGSIF